MKTKRPYNVPEPRTFKKWCDNLGLVPKPVPKDLEMILSFDDFCFFPNTEFRKTQDGALYGYWREFGDLWGECRTVQEWLIDFKWELVEPTDEDLNDLNLFLGHDEFWEWSSGKVEYEKSSLWEDFKQLIKRIITNPNNG